MTGNIYTGERWELRQGDVLARLLELSDNSVQCVVTSPPYWGLRDYGLTPTIWDGTDTCQHNWAQEVIRQKGGRWQNRGLDNSQEFRDARDSTAQVLNLGSTCLDCGAWRGCLGLEPTPQLFVQHLVQIFREVRRVLRPDGNVWLNLGDSFCSTAPLTFRDGLRQDTTTLAAKHWSEDCSLARRKFRPATPTGMKPKDMVGIPWMVALTLRDDGWYLRSEIIWHKKSPMPESVRDRPTKSHEQIFLLTKSRRYYYDRIASAESAGGKSSGNKSSRRGTNNTPERKSGEGEVERWSGFPAEGSEIRNMRSAWTLSTGRCKAAHFAVFPTQLVRGGVSWPGRQREAAVQRAAHRGNESSKSIACRQDRGMIQRFAYLLGGTRMKAGTTRLTVIVTSPSNRKRALNSIRP